MLKIFNLLLDRYGPQHWWPAKTKDEVVIGAILTQNTAWTNVEKAIKNLSQKNLLSLHAIAASNLHSIKEAIKPAGFFNQKSVYLKNIAEFFMQNGGFEQLSQLDTETLRKQLLTIKGIGKETADSILLYAFDRAVFVVDAYTKRLILRHKLSGQSDYESLRLFFENNLPKDYRLFNEFHALIVKNAKEFCRKKPFCDNCPLKEIL